VATSAFFTNLARWKFSYENRLVEILRESYDILICERCPKNVKKITVNMILKTYLPIFIPQHCMITWKHFAVKNSICRTWLSLRHRTTNLSWFRQHNMSLQKRMRTSCTDKHCWSSHVNIEFKRLCHCPEIKEETIRIDQISVGKTKLSARSVVNYSVISLTQDVWSSVCQHEHPHV